jgi:hypothetical protein
MRSIHWLFVVSVALFVSGLGFVIVGARTDRNSAPADDVPITTAPVASVKQIMKGIVGPATEVLFNAVTTTVTTSGIEEKAPQNDEEWEAVGNSAAALIESGNLLMMGSRVVDKQDWIKMSQAMIDAGKVALKATEAKSADELLASGEAINTSCDACHVKYQRGS